MQIYLVGGAVRDGLLGLPIRERDWVVTGSTPDEMKQQGYTQVGKDFPVFLHPVTKEEYALARTERKTGSGYTGFTCQASPSVTLEEDLLRRDLTINAMAQDITGAIIDPYGGRADLQKKVLRHVSPAFAEDPLRILRVARFLARFHHGGFTLAPETLALMQQMVVRGEVDFLVAERIWREFQTALNERNPEVFIHTLRACHALAIVMPEIDRLFGVPQRQDYHPEIDTGIHAVMSLQLATRLSQDARVRFAALVHDVGKADTPPDIWPRHIGHEKRSVPIINRLCKRLSIPNDYRDLALIAAEYHTHCHRSGELKEETVYRVLKACGAFRSSENLEQFLTVCEADARGRKGLENQPYGQAERFRQALRACQAVSTVELQREGYQGVHLGQELQRRHLEAIRLLAPRLSGI